MRQSDWLKELYRSGCKFGGRFHSVDRKQRPWKLPHFLHCLKLKIKTGNLKHWQQFPSMMLGNLWQKLRWGHGTSCRMKTAKAERHMRWFQMLVPEETVQYLIVWYHTEIWCFQNWNMNLVIILSQSQWGICIAPLTIMDSGAEHVRSWMK